MKTPSCLILCLALLGSTPAFSQQPGPEKPPAAAPKRVLTKFDLDFPGGTPAELVVAVQKAMGRPLNTIVPTEFAAQKLPAFRVSGVDIAELFGGLRQASHVQQQIINSGPGEDFSVSRFIADIGFMTDDSHPSDDSVWYFFAHDAESQTAILPTVCKFYLLTPLLERGLTVDDITTAIQTGWKMLGDAKPPSISFHKETNLLIAVGDVKQLETISAALKALDASRPNAVTGQSEQRTQP